MKKYFFVIMIMVYALMGTACTKPGTHSSLKLNDASKKEKLPDAVIFGRASWYGVPFHGRTTANGERYNMYDMTAAHKSLPFGSTLRVINLTNNRIVTVRINDRGPYIPGRVLDLSYAAATELDMIHEGVGKVKIEVYKPEPKLVAKK
ncbi:MAG: septal ring lytic transglycosylase RlpA family protein [Deltaproteobacteria bacterium]|nr:septal ring lytic transglycosylase RlpA family protein [Deltaproteobacteria bacterium]